MNGQRLSRLRMAVCFFVLIFFVSIAGSSALQAQLAVSAAARKGIDLGLETGMKWNKQSITEAVSALIDVSHRTGRLYYREETARCFREAARLKLILGSPRESVRLLERSLSIERRIGKGGGRAETEAMLAYANAVLGNARASHRKISDAIQSLGAESTVPNPAALYYLGETYYLFEDVPKLMEYHERAFSQYRLMRDESGEARSRLALAYGNLARDDVVAGIEQAQAANDMFVVLGDIRGRTMSLVALGLAQFRNGEPRMALNSFSLAESMFPPDIDLSEKAILVYNIGRVYEYFGDCEATTSYYRRSLELFKDEGNKTLSVGNEWSLGKVLNDCGFPNEGERHLDRSLSGARVSGKAHDEIVALVELAKLFAARDELPRAEQLGIQALSLTGHESFLWAKALVLRTLGDIYLKMGRQNDARKFFMTALEIDRTTRDDFGESATLTSLGSLATIGNDQRSALANVQAAVEITEKLTGKVENSKLARSFFSKSFERYELYIHLLMNGSENPSAASLQALKASESARARTLMENLSLSGVQVLKDGSPELIAKEKNLRSLLNIKSDLLVNALGNGKGNEEIERLTSEISDIENKLEETKALLKTSSPIYSAIKNPEPFDVADFQREVLGEDDLLLEFSVGKEESYLWAVDKRDVTAYYLPPREQIEKRVEKLRGLLGARQLNQGEAFEDYQKRLADAEVDYKTEARALSHELLGQVPADKLAGKRLIVVADGRLHYFPLGSLPMPGVESDEPILLTNEVVYEPSASALKIFRMEKKAEAKPQKDLLVFADPVFSRSDERIAGLDKSNHGLVSMILPTFRSIESLESMPRLPASEDEAKSISNVVGSNQTTVRAGFAASRDGVLNGGIEDYKILHFATHGLIDEKRPELSGILLSLYTDEGKRNDGGFIRLQDVYGMRLNSDLVVLSACETGIGKEIKGEGVMSLNNAFLQAGAKSVVSSLWKVDDAATKDLMTDFYRGMADDNLTAAAALRQAQIKMYNDPRYRSPFYWGAFTASGDAGVKVAFTSYAWLYAVIAAAVIAAALLAFLAVCRHSRGRR